MAQKRAEYSPPVELPSSNAKNFFEEAKIGQEAEEEVLRKFRAFSHNGYMELDDFISVLEAYECCPAVSYEAFFYAFDRDNDDKISFDEFFLGCCAADPSTVHILNSFTGYERAQYVFDFYDVNRSKTLEFNEFARLTAECLSLPTNNPNDEVVRREAILKARQLGALEDVGQVQHFTCIKFRKFYEFIQSERLRGTSRLFRFQKSLTKKAKLGQPPKPLPIDDAANDDDWLDHWLDLDVELSLLEAEKEQRPQPEEPLAPYSLHPAPEPPQVRLNLNEPSQPGDAQGVARHVLQQVLQNTEQFLLRLSEPSQPYQLLNHQQLVTLCVATARQLASDELVVEVSSPCKVFGALHGQVLDLLSFFRAYGTPERSGDLNFTHYVFLGDYVDRGAHSLELVTLLFSLKVLHPTRVTLLRGHHENRLVNCHLGFLQECERRLQHGAKVWEMVNGVFEYMSLGARIEDSVLCMPGGIPPSLVSIDQLKVPKPVQLPAARAGDVLADLFANQQAPRELSSFLRTNGLASIIRSRQIPEKGFHIGQQGRLLTVCSCLNYCDAARSDAAFFHVTLSRDGQQDRLRIDPKRLSTKRPSRTNGLVVALGRFQNFDPWASVAEEEPLRWPRQPRALSPQRFLEDKPKQKDDKRREPQLQSVSIRVEDQQVQTHEHAYLHLSGKSTTAWCSAPLSLDRAGKKGWSDRKASPRDDLLVRPGLPVPIVPQLAEPKEKKKPADTAPRRTSGATAQSPKLTPKARAASAKAKATARPARSPKEDADGKEVERLLQLVTMPEAASLGPADLPPSPTAYLDKPPGTGHPLLTLLCQQWQQAKLSDTRWQQSVKAYEDELGEQHSPKRGKGGWSVETFSMWLLKKGRRLRECSQWFKAFDFNQDRVISVVDFLLGVAACQPAMTVCRSLALLRLADADGKGQLQASQLEQFLSAEVYKQLSPRSAEQKAKEWLQGHAAIDAGTFLKLLQRVDTSSVLQLDI